MLRNVYLLRLPMPKFDAILDARLCLEALRVIVEVMSPQKSISLADYWNVKSYLLSLLLLPARLSAWTCCDAARDSTVLWPVLSTWVLSKQLSCAKTPALRIQNVSQGQ